MKQLQEILRFFFFLIVFHPIICLRPFSFCLEIHQHYLKRFKNGSPLLHTDQLTSNHQQGHGIHHRSGYEIIPFLQQPYLRSPIWFQTRSLFFFFCIPCRGSYESESSSRHFTLDILLLLSQQWMKAPNVRH